MTIDHHSCGYLGNADSSIQGQYDSMESVLNIIVTPI